MERMWEGSLGHEVGQVNAGGWGKWKRENRKWGGEGCGGGGILRDSGGIFEGIIEGDASILLCG